MLMHFYHICGFKGDEEEEEESPEPREHPEKVPRDPITKPGTPPEEVPDVMMN